MIQFQRKKAKTEEENSDKENVPESPRNEPQVSLINNPVLPILHGLGLLKPSTDDDDESDDDESDDDESDVDDNDDSSVLSVSDDELGNQQQEPISSIADNDGAGEDHPTNKQYLIYTNSNPNKDGYVISKTARYWSLKYRKDLRHVIPDLYNMYIHSDFECYGELEVVENCLMDLTKTLFFYSTWDCCNSKNRRESELSTWLSSSGSFDNFTRLYRWNQWH